MRAVILAILLMVRQIAKN